MLQSMRSLIGLNPKNPPPSRRLSGVRRLRYQPPDMLETVHEIAIYIHRFHNLDLFQQGWYQLKISAKWEDNTRKTLGTPSRVVQYEAPGMTMDEILGVWKIDDSDNSFYTQPFQIKYAKQDVFLCIMVSFNMVIRKDETQSTSTSAVILKFELMYAPKFENGSGVQASFGATQPAVHEFRIPSKALFGLHSYCPVHFDAFNAVLVDLSIHVVFRKAGSSIPSKKLPSNTWTGKVDSGDYEEQNQILGQGWGSKAIELVKCLLASREILLDEFKKISKSIGQTVDDLNDADLHLGRFEYAGSSSASTLSSSTLSGSKVSDGQLAGLLQNILQKYNGTVEYGSDIMLYSLTKEELLDAFLTVGSQLSFIWSIFLEFHRKNRNQILEHLHDVWAADQKAEWSIWMIHSKAEIPHRYLSSVDDSFQHNSLERVVGPRKSSEEPAQNASSRAGLHRRSIAQMKINSQSIQDMQIFGDPSRVPVVLVDHHVMNVAHDSSDYNSSMDSIYVINTTDIHAKPAERVVPKLKLGSMKNDRVLKVVVFVHGFQGHHLDLRLVRNQWVLIDPGAECLMSSVNEDKTSGDFRDMGSRLADEVIAFVRKKMDKLSRNGGCKDIKLSFVGHSIGNIIIRTALTESKMAPYLKHLYTYMSVSGPHLGYCYSSNSLFNYGLWLLKKLKGAKCIHQLTLTDDPDLHNTFFYWLCKQKTLEKFKNIILLSSPQDGYVPYHSARIELCHASSWDTSKKAQVFLEMLNNCLDQLHAPSSEMRILMRCDVNFDISTQGMNLNTIIGRAAHIEFLERDIFAKFIIWSFPELFL